MRRRFKTVSEIAAWRLCTGCGACAAACPEKNLTLVDVPTLGLRPFRVSTGCRHCGRCVAVCPGVEMTKEKTDAGAIPKLRKGWGEILEIWEGYACDPEIRYQGSSGGVATAISLFCLEKERMTAVLQIRAHPEIPWRNVPVLSVDRTDVVMCTGSRYSPASPCEKIDMIKNASSPCVFIGKPCDVAALRKFQNLDQEIVSKVGLAISIFCAGTPSTAGTKAVFSALGVSEDQVEQISYRGCGWPGTTKVKLHSPNDKELEMGYEQSWGAILSKYVQFRCRICPDSTGEFADICCGDAWHRNIDGSQPGYSLVLVRTEKGRKTLTAAIKAGYVHLRKADPDALPLSQMPLLNKKRNIWGRVLAMRMLAVPCPRFKGFSLFANWRELSLRDKSQSLLGTAYRIISRRWNKPLDVSPAQFDETRRFAPASCALKSCDSEPDNRPT